MRRLWSALPGPAVVKALELAVLVVVALVALFFLFEWAGGFLDSGGAIGA
ncbi:MAG: hypothetical protein ACLFWM_14495 [Actinomycetota bacterium]